MTPDKIQKLTTRLAQHPELYERLNALLNIAENTNGNCTTAHATEEQLTAELQRLSHYVSHPDRHKIT